MSGLIDPATVQQEGRRDEKEWGASQWKLIWWKFASHKVAVASALVLILLYGLGALCEFVAPYDPTWRDREYILAPPQRVRLVDENGLHFRPLVYGKSMARNPVTSAREYVDDRSQSYPLKLLVHGQEYKLWGLFRSDIHLFGTDGGSVHLFGTDGLGRDLLSRTLYGARISLSIGLIGVALSFALGLVIGSAAGLLGGVFDSVVQRIIEIVRSFPAVPLWMGLSAAIPPTWAPLNRYLGILVILSLLGWTDMARVARGKILSLRSEDFVLAARVSGSSNARIVAIHLIPSFMSHIIASLTLAIPGMILGETALRFLGLGLQEPVVSWGVMLSAAQSLHVVAFSPWQMIPGLFVVLTVLAFNFFGDGIRDAADPYDVPVATG